MRNDPYIDQSATRQPRLRVKVNGNIINGALRVSVTSNNYYQCDKFSFSAVLSIDPDGWWDVDPPMMAEIELSLDGSAWTSIMVGEVDHVHPHIQGGIVDMEGRDLSARFIESKTQEAFINQTSSQVAQALAARHGMTADVTATTTLVGRYYEQDHSNISLGQFSKTTTEWDLLTYLAQREGFDVFMEGSTLHFQPSVDPASDPYIINWEPFNPTPRLNVISINMERSLTLAKDVQVKVKSWNSKRARSFERTARAIGGKAASASGVSSGGKPTTTQQYVIVRPNLTEEQAQQLANTTAHEITLHERVVNVEMPGELRLTPRIMVKLQGTNTSFDQAYYVASIDRSLSFDEGFRQSVRLKNSSPRTQAQV